MNMKRRTYLKAVAAGAVSSLVAGCEQHPPEDCSLQRSSIVRQHSRTGVRVVVHDREAPMGAEYQCPVEVVLYDGDTEIANRTTMIRWHGRSSTDVGGSTVNQIIWFEDVPGDRATGHDAYVVYE